MIRSDRLFFGVMFFALIGVFFGMFEIMIFQTRYMITYIPFWWILLLPYIFIKILFPKSGALVWFHSVPNKILLFYKNYYSKIKTY